MKYYRSSEIYSEKGIIDGFIGVSGKEISCIGEGIPDGEYEDFGNCRMIPGIIDTHVHGTMGYGLFNHHDLNREQIKNEIRGFVKAMTIHGVTGVFPTAKPGVFDLIAEVASENIKGARILGIHSEGPWQNRVGEKGRPRPYPQVSLESAKQIVQDCQGRLKLMGLAPEIPGIDPIIEYLVEQNVTISFCHSDMNYHEATQSIKKGISVATHIGNVMSGLHHRDVGGCGAMLLSDDVDCEVICDGLHLVPEYLRILFQVKDTSRFMMISDSNYIAGAKPGHYMNSRNMETIIDEDGINRDSDGRISGSTKSVLYGMKILTEKLNMPMETVVRMASFNASKKYGFKHKGSIAVGKDADFVIINQNFQSVCTCVEGEIVHRIEQPAIEYNPFYKKLFNMK